MRDRTSPLLLGKMLRARKYRFALCFKVLSNQYASVFKFNREKKRFERAKVNSRCFHWFPAAMSESLRWAPTWHLHTEHYYHTLNSLTLSWLAESIQWIFEISASDVITADYTIIMSRTLKVTGNHVMYDSGAWFLRVIMSSSRALCCLPSVKKQKHEYFFFQCIIKQFRFGFCDIQNNRGLGKGYQPQPSAPADNSIHVVSAHPFCACKITCHVMHRAHALSAKMNNDRADGDLYSFAWI